MVSNLWLSNDPPPYDKLMLYLNTPQMTYSNHLETVNNEVDGTVNDNKEMRTRDQNVHLWGPDFMVA